MQLLDLLGNVVWLGPVGIFGAWLWLGEVKRRERFLPIAGAVVLVQAVAGAVAGSSDSDSYTTMLGLGLLYSSTSWILVPALASCFGSNRLAFGIPLGFVTPVMGGVLGVLIAVLTGEISPCR